MGRFAEEWCDDMGAFSDQDLREKFEEAETMMSDYPRKQRKLEDEQKNAEETATMCAREFMIRHLDDD